MTKIISLLIILFGSLTCAAWRMTYTMTTKDRTDIAITKTDTGMAICVDAYCAELTNQEASSLADHLRPEPEPDPEFKRILDEITKTANGCKENRFIEADKRAVEDMKGFQRIK